MTSYLIGGKEFQLRPLTQRQRHLASPMERKMRELIMKLADLTPSGGKGELKPLFDVSVEMDELIFSEDEAFEKFLATILVPAEAEKWTPAMIEQNKDLMWDITEDVQAEVLRDFFGRAMNSPIASPVSISPSTSEPKPSETSGQAKDSTNPTT